MSTQKLQEKKIESARLEAEWFLCEILECDRAQLMTNQFFTYELTPPQQGRLEEWLGRRREGEPFAYIVGYKDFYRSRFFVGPGVLIPRPETEMLVELAENWLKKKKEKNLTILDLGCGSGCIGLSILKESQGNLIAVDCSSFALSYTTRNTQKLKLENRVTLVHSRVQDLVGQEKKNFIRLNSVDLITANPPYIGINDVGVEASVIQYEPSLALFGGERGTEETKDWIPLFANFLKKNGILLLEHGATQRDELMKDLEMCKKFDSIESFRDLSGRDRIIMAKKRG